MRFLMYIHQHVTVARESEENILINPYLIETTAFGFEFRLAWYGVIVFISFWLFFHLAVREGLFRKQDVSISWDILLYGFIGGFPLARLYYVINDIVGGNPYYLLNPGNVFAYWEGGWHIFGAIIGAILGVLVYALTHQFDALIILDCMAFPMLVVQGVGRLANFTSQSLYGPPTDLAWGIPISAQHRILAWVDLAQFPVETTRFHPTFAYDLILHLLAAALLFWLTRQYKSHFGIGSAFYLYLILAGVSRFITETWRPDQPIVFEPAMTTTRLVTLVAMMIGAVLLWRNQAGQRGEM